MDRAVKVIANVALFTTAALLGLLVVGYFAVAVGNPANDASAGLRALWGLIGLAVPVVAGFAWIWGRKRGDPPLVVAQLVAAFALAAVVAVLISMFILAAFVG